MEHLARIAETDGLLAEWGRHFGPWAYALLAGLVLFQTAFVFGWLVPGNVLLFTVGLLCHPQAGIFQVGPAWGAMALGALLGNVIGYTLGAWAEPWLERLPGPLRLTPEARQKAQSFFDRQGQRAVPAALFLPFIRSFIPTVAGLSGMHFRVFAGASVLGAIAWTGIFVIAGRWMGNLPFIREYLGAVVVVVTVYAAGSMALGAWRARARRAASDAASA